MALTTMTNIAPTDRVLKLKLMDSKKPLNSLGMVDPRLFTGENNIHVVKDVQTNFWSFKYDSGVIPEALSCKFTNFTSAVKHATLYYKNRNIEVEVIN